MPRPPSDPELKGEFSARINELLKESTAAKIAAALQVERQMVYNYRDARNAPSFEVIRRALETWPELRISYRGKVLTLQDFHKRPILTGKKVFQFELWDLIKKLDSESLEIEILEKGTTSLQLGVRIRFRSTG